MYLERPQEPSLITLKVTNYLSKPSNPEIGFCPYWDDGKITVKAQKLGFLLALAASLQEACRELEGVRLRERLECIRSWEPNYHDSSRVHESAPKEVFEWRKFFSKEQLKMIVEEPEIAVRYLHLRQLSHFQKPRIFDFGHWQN